MTAEEIAQKELDASNEVKRQTAEDESKAKAEDMITQSNLNWIAYRFATAFGASPRMRYDLLINDLTRKAIKDGYFVVYEPEFNRTFIHVRDLSKSFVFAINNITRADIILIKQLEKMPDPSGPFWSEVFERSIQDVRGNLMDDEWKGSEEKTKIFRNYTFCWTFFITIFNDFCDI